jgi:Domain of unknown function (DUF4398)
MEEFMYTRPTLTLVAATCLAAGCASTPDRADMEIVRAETNIEHAEAGNAAELAPSTLKTARDKLAAARLAAEQGDEDTAAQLAAEAALDADLAVAQAEQSEAESALREVQNGIQTLRDELTRDGYRPGGTQ